MSHGPGLTCPSCRGFGPDGAFVAHMLDDDGRCAGCLRVHRQTSAGISVCLRRDDDEAIAMTERAEAWARAMVAG